MKKRRRKEKVDYGTPLNEYLCTEYLYHCICHQCGAVRHDTVEAHWKDEHS